MRTPLLLVLLSLAACKHTEPAPETAAATPGNTAPAEPGAGGEPAQAGPAAPLARMMIPPSQGQSSFRAEGCAASSDGMPEATRALPSEEKVEASALGTGIVVSHDLPHACCLKAESKVKIDGAQVTITETLSGTPCRCMCSSTLRTAVGLKKGTWDVSVKTVEPGKSRTAWNGELVVQ